MHRASARKLLAMLALAGLMQNATAQNFQGPTAFDEVLSQFDEVLSHQRAALT